MNYQPAPDSDICQQYAITAVLASLYLPQREALETLREQAKLKRLDEIGKEMYLLNAHILTVGRKEALMRRREQLKAEAYRLRFE